MTAVQDPEAQVPDPADPASGPLFDLDAYLRTFNPKMMAVAECRRLLSRFDPLAFALTYLPHHLRGEETGERITFSEFHLDVIEQAKHWAVRDDRPAAHRDSYIAPRGCGKSTWFFLILPLWAAAHGHRKFAAAFADSARQAELHLATFKKELNTNSLLRQDFPDLCHPARRPAGTVESDNQSMLICKNGFVFAARGIDGSSLGMKVGERRPDLLILDDVEPGEETYSDYQAEKRLGAILDSVLPLNIYARVVLVGTVTMPGSIVHQLVKSVTLDEPPETWITDEGFRAHYYPAIVTDDAGDERSIWPAKWSLEFLQSIRHTRQYKKNYANDPAGRDGEYWNETDFVYGSLPGLTHQLLSIDPAVTAKKKSDYTALAVIGYSAVTKRCVVRWARAVKIQPGEPLRQLVLRVLDQYPDIRGVLIETNQGGDTWRAILRGLPVPVKTVHQSEPKEVRAARLLNFYQRRPPRPKTPAETLAGGPDVAAMPYVVHEQKLPAVEEQMVSFPKGNNDDLVDCVGTGVDVFLRRLPKKRSSASTVDQQFGSTDDDEDDYLAS